MQGSGHGVFLAGGVNKVVKIEAREVGPVDRVFEELRDHSEVSVSPDLAPVGPARLATYDSPSAPPEVEEIHAQSPVEFIGLLATRVYSISQEKGGRVPFLAIKEVVENLAHAGFREVVVSILQDGNVVTVSDQGPGFADKSRALQPGYSSAGAAIKGFVKGVGSGLPVASGSLAAVGGTLKLEDNVGRGAVVTLAVPSTPAPAKERAGAESGDPLRLSKRQKKVVFLVLEVGSVGPSRIAGELSVGLSTAYRDLQDLEKMGLIKCDKRGKRSLTDYGIDSLDTIING